MNRSTLQKIVAAVIVVVILAVVLAFIGKSHAPKTPALSIDTTDQPTRGNPNAKVHIIVFEDLKCIACRNFNNTVLPRLKTEYIDKGIAKYTVINVAFIQWVHAGCQCGPLSL